MVTIRTTLLIFLLATLKLSSQTIISGGDIAGTWDLEGSPYIVNGDITIESDERLAIDEGVEIRFAGNYSIIVKGRIDASGTEDQKIIFTLDDTTGFVSGLNQGWAGFIFMYGFSLDEGSLINHCVVEYSSVSGITCLNYPNLEIRNSLFRNNKNYGITLYEFSDIIIDGVVLTQNQNGGLEIQHSAPQVSNFEISGNGGPGIFATGSSLGGSITAIQDGDIHGNYSENFGGGIYLDMDFLVQLNNLEIYENSSSYGGAIYNGDGLLKVANCNLNNNQAIQGGGIFNAYSARLEMEYSLITDNHASDKGGALYSGEGNAEMRNITVSGNHAGSLGGAFFIENYSDSPGTILNSIIWNNVPDEIICTGNTPEVSFSNVMYGYAGVQNINADPLFEDPENGIYNLTWLNYPTPGTLKSPCIDSGDPVSGNDPDGTIADMGALYFDQTTITAVNTKHMDKKVRIFPNPAVNWITVENGTGSESVSIIDLSGAVVKTFNRVTTGSKLNISELSEGIFIVTLIDENGLYSTQKLIKK